MSRRRDPRTSADRLVHPRLHGAACWPALDADAGVILMLQANAAAVDGFTPLSRSHVGDRAVPAFEWMCARPGDWPVWGRVAALFGEAGVRSMVLGPAECEAEEAAIAAEEARVQREERARLRQQIDLFVLDQKGRRPGLSLESGDETKPFFLMRFSEKWERERVLDWLRWQKERFLGFRDLLEAEGTAAVERAIIAGMRETEAEVKARGLSSGGRRPLRFWRGE